MFSRALNAVMLCANSTLPSPTVIEEVIVTAQKRAQPIEVVPIAVTAFDGDTTRQLRWDSAADVQQQTPNLYIKESFNQVNPTIYLRGVGINDFNSNVSSAVGVYVDEAYIGSPSALLFPLFDLERIEVLAGPQGTLYGRNTTAGLIHFVTRKPTDRTEAYVSARYGRFDELKFQGALGGALGANSQGRFAINAHRRDGVGTNLLTGNDVNEIDNWAARLQLAWQSSTATEVLLRLQAADSSAPARQYKNRGLINGADVLGYVDTPDPDTGFYNREGPEQVQVADAALRIVHDGKAADFISISSYQAVDRLSDENSDASPARLLELKAENHSWHISQELRWQGRSEEDWDWTAGLNYYADSIDSNFTFDVLRDLRPAVGFDPMRGVFFARQIYTQDTEAAAAFGQLEVPLDGAWSLSAGLRYTWEQRDFVSSAVFEEAFGQVPILEVDNSTDFAAWSGRLALEYALDNDGVAYASISRGFKSGGFNGGLAFTPREVEPFDEETLISYEIGFKRGFADDRARAGAAAFFYDYSDLQVFSIVNTGGVPISVLDNAADAEVAGVEAWIDARPTEALRLRLGLGLLNTETTRFLTDQGERFTGNELVGAPDLTFNGLLGYRWPLPRGSIAAQVDYRYTGEFFFDTANSPRLQGGGYWLVNAQIAWRSPAERVEVALWGANVFDQRYIVNAFDVSDFGFDQLRWSDPVTFGVSLSWALR